MPCSTTQKHTIAKIDGELVPYDACSERRYKVYDAKVYRYIGKGTIHSVGGVEQNFKRTHYFWVYRR